MWSLVHKVKLSFEWLAACEVAQICRWTGWASSTFPAKQLTAPMVAAAWSAASGSCALENWRTPCIRLAGGLTISMLWICRRQAKWVVQAVTCAVVLTA
jgi:hypothetical protein